MTAWMPPPVTRKRPAPGASPIGNIQMPNQTFPAQQQVGNTDYMWNQAPAENRIYPEVNYNNMAGYGAMPNSHQPNFTNPNTQTPSTQLARRPHSQLIQAGQRAQFHNPNEWAMAEDVGFESNTQNGGLAENDSIDRLEERAAAAKRDAQSKRKQIPPFVQKLNSFLDDGKNTELIRWSDRGDSFVVLDEDEFAKTLIPELFKHNNYASFVRQLNMYGFHKRVGLSDNSMKASERKNKSPSEYYNPYFKRGHPNLLWLINKPKNPQKKGKGGRAKQEEGAEDSDDDNKDNIEDVYVYGQDQHIPRAISAAPDGGQAGPVALTVVQKQLRDIQQQQINISNMINRLKRDNENLYAQADSFNQQHNRHETSINAILSFLATIYNRSLDGQNGGADLARMFAGAVSQDQHQQGSVVDLSNMNQGQANGNASPMRRPPRLIMAPPGQQDNSSGGGGGHVSNVSTPSTAGHKSSSNYGRLGSTPQSGAIEEVFENSPGRSPESTTNVKPDPANANSPSSVSNSTPTQATQTGGQPRRNIVDLINSTNANAPPSQDDMAFPDVLQHYQTANGNSPLTNQQRKEMLDLISSSSGGPQPGGLNALSSPSPMPVPNFDQLNYSQAELQRLMQLQQDQDSKISQVSDMLGPLTPSGHIPGVDGVNGGYFPNGGQSPNVDLDQFLDTGAYYNVDPAADVGAGGYNFDGTGVYGNDAMAPGLDFSMGGMGMDGTGIGGMNTSGTSPSSTAADGLNNGDASLQGSREGSPKRRRVD